MRINIYDAANILRDALQKRAGITVDEIQIESYDKDVIEINFIRSMDGIVTAHHGLFESRDLKHRMNRSHTRFKK